MTDHIEQIQQLRQGDVLLLRIQPPHRAQRVDGVQGLRVEGERTGHAHVLEAEVYDTPTGRVLHIDGDRMLTHEEHAALLVPDGWWQPVLQREFEPRRRPSLRNRWD